MPAGFGFHRHLLARRFSAERELAAACVSAARSLSPQAHGSIDTSPEGRMGRSAPPLYRERGGEGARTIGRSTGCAAVGGAPRAPPIAGERRGSLRPAASEAKTAPSRSPSGRPPTPRSREPVIDLAGELNAERRAEGRRPASGVTIGRRPLRRRTGRKPRAAGFRPDRLPASHGRQAIRTRALRHCGPRREARPIEPCRGGHSRRSPVRLGDAVAPTFSRRTTARAAFAGRSLPARPRTTADLPLPTTALCYPRAFGSVRSPKDWRTALALTRRRTTHHPRRAGRGSWWIP